MKLVVGLGNPGRKYELTRHNVGWWVVDHLADVWHFEPWRRDGDALVSDGRRGTHRVRLLKPQTFMNLSGSALRPYLRRETFRADRDLLVIVDDIALPVAKPRIRASGSAGGHNGLKSIEAAVGSQDYYRLRVGIRPLEPEREVGDLADFVLSQAGKDERARLFETFPALATLIDAWIDERPLQPGVLPT